MRTYVVVFALSLLASLLLTRFVRDAALRWQLVDEPVGGRKIHRRPIPRLGGIAIAMAFALPLLSLAGWNNRLSAQFLGDSSLLMALLGGGGLIIFAGVLDDLRGIRSLVKLAAQVAAALLVYEAGVQIEAISVPFFSPIHLDSLSLPVTVFWIVLVTNALNLIDGMDGLAGGVAVLAGGTLFIMSLIEGNEVAALLLACMVGATLGFLFYNINPASIFMGDTGSLTLGFVLAVVSVHSAQKSYTLFSIVAAILVLGLPIFDLSMAVVRRYLMGLPLFAADQHHVHHILLRKGLSQSQSVILLFAAAVVLELLAFIFIYAEDHLSALAIVALVPLIALAVRFLGYDRIITSARRARVMEHVEERAAERGQRVESFRNRIQGQPRRGDLEKALAEVAESLELERLEVLLNFSLRPNEQPWSYRWIRGVEDERSASVHIQSRQELTLPLQVGGLILGELRLTAHQERGVFAPHDRALYRSIADGLTLSLAARSSVLTMHDLHEPVHQVNASWN